jgi:hypothetical protein
MKKERIYLLGRPSHPQELTLFRISIIVPVPSVVALFLLETMIVSPVDSKTVAYEQLRLVRKTKLIIWLINVIH